MSCYTIYYKDGAKWMRPVRSEAEYRALRDSERNRAADKRHMVQMNYSCLPRPLSPSLSPEGEEGVVTSVDAGCGPLKGSTRASNSVGMDIDILRNENEDENEYQKRLAAIPKLIMSKKDELGLLMLERSASKGYHIAFRRRAGLSQEENLRWASELLGVEYDEGAKDITRVFFTPADKLLFLDEELFSSEPPYMGKGVECRKDETQALQCCSVATENVEVASESATEGTAGALTYGGHKYEVIIAKYWELFNEGKEPHEGDRNVKTYELAMTLRAICDYDQQRMEQVIPRYDGFDEAEWRKTIANALAEPRKGMPWRLRQVLQALKADRKIEATGGTRQAPPPLPKRLPPLIKLLTRNVPDYYKPAVASAVFPALATHMHGVKFRYWDNVEHEATFMNVLIGRQSVGKGSIAKPISLVLESIVERDKEGRRREAEWKRNNPSGKTKPKDPRPEDICIQVLIDNLTDAVFNQRIVDADRNGQRYVYVRVDEIEALKKVTSKGTVDEVGLLIRKAFDNALHGQERVGADSVSGIAPLRWNFNASTTPPNARRFFQRMVNDGTVGRLDIATIVVDRSAPGYKAPVMGIYDEEFEQELKPYLDRIGATTGLIECPQSKALALKMRDENDLRADDMESEAYRVLSQRANVIAWLKGMLLYVAHGFRWTKEISDFVQWSQSYNLWCKMLFFGEQLEEELKEEEAIMRHAGPQGMFDLLPQQFSIDEYRQLRQRLGKEGDGESTLRSWVHRKQLIWDEAVGMYVKI